jgi:hypothetical protein
MRHSNQFARGRRLPAGVVGLAVSVVTALVVACGGSAATPPPSAQPTPVVTPDPHLADPVTADAIFLALQRGKIPFTTNNAILGHGNEPLIKQINMNLGGWPLRIVQYRSSAEREKLMSWKDGAKPGRDEPPFAFAAFNIVVQYGPISVRAPGAPASDRQAFATQIVDVLDPLLWPLEQHSVVAIPARTPAPTPAPVVSAAPSKAPAKSPKPSPKP